MSQVPADHQRPASPPPLNASEPQRSLSRARFDERDTIFARMERKPGTAAYQEYYRRNPERRQIDDRLRSMPELCSPGGRFYEPIIMAQADRNFRDIESIQPDEELARTLSAFLREARDPGAAIKTILRRLGAVASGSTSVRDFFVYSHKGRFDRDYGAPVHLEHPTAILFLVEMNFHEMRHAPRAATLRESSRQYFRAATISKTLTAVLNSCGYQATSHHDAHYQVILPGLAVQAGLGELGRNNILVADRFGSRVRIGAVTTTMILKHDPAVDLGISRFCRICSRCAHSCPARALTAGEKSEIRGILKWPTNSEQCYAYWRSVGTDCGICMAVCPFSHRNTWFHNFVRFVVRKSPRSHRALLYLEELIYGNAWRKTSLQGTKSVVMAAKG